MSEQEYLIAKEQIDGLEAYAFEAVTPDGHDAPRLWVVPADRARKVIATQAAEIERYRRTITHAIATLENAYETETFPVGLLGFLKATQAIQDAALEGESDE